MTSDNDLSVVSVTVDGKEIDVDKRMTVLQACEVAGHEIPRFCYHEKLKIAGNCRMCLVEIERQPKLAASCSMPVAEGMVIKTSTKKVKDAREGVMEMLLINHPLDCPICDQGGECDLQDQAVLYGCGTGRFEENKRSVKNKNFGNLIKTEMNRCIHCTRCVRFMEDVAGTSELCMLMRGEDSEISIKEGTSITSEMSGNIIDLCPVGALTSKPYAFTARSWELSHCETIDVLDAVGSNIIVNHKNQEVMRILPRVNEEINEEWISDKTRFFYDGLKNQRLDVPYIKDSNGNLIKTDWNTALSIVSEKIEKTSKNKMLALIGGLVDCESIFALKDMLVGIECNNMDYRSTNSNVLYKDRSNYLFNTTIQGIESADLILLVGANPRLEATMINARIRKRFLSGELKIFNIGAEIDLNYDFETVSSSPKFLSSILNEEDKSFCRKLKKAKNPMLIIGQDCLSRSDAEVILSTCSQIAEKFGFIKDNGKTWNGFNILHRDASHIGALDLDFLPRENGFGSLKLYEKSFSKELDVLYLVNFDNIDFSKIRDNTFIIYQGHHGDIGADKADIILPSAAFTEKDGIYLNTEGRVQYSYKAVDPVGLARPDYDIIMQLANMLSIKLEYNDLHSLRVKMLNDNPVINIENGCINFTEWTSIVQSKRKFSESELYLSNFSFYSNDIISKNSIILNKHKDNILKNNKTPCMEVENA